ncbi:MAG: SurA N-terminal domain-containing protein [Terriglobales bacterium]
MKKKVLILICIGTFFALIGLASAGEVIDRIVATVNGHIILLSDWEDALRYQAFSSARPLDQMTAEDRKSTLDHLIDQELLREQLDASNVQPASPEDVAQRVVEIRKQYPEAETELGWRALLDRYRLNQGSLTNQVALELELMRLVDARLRPSVTVDSKSIESYYNQELLPQLRQSGGQNVPLANVTAKIKEVLTQKKINQLLVAWLQNLRAGSEIRAEALTAGSGGRSQ